MPRRARVVIPDCPHHVTQRGNYRQNVFHSPADYDYYCELIAQYSAKYATKIHAYCLMTNHIHFIATPPDADALAKLFNTAHMRYSQYINRKQHASGHLWQGRFFSCVLDPAHLYKAVRYVEQNPVRAGVAKRAWDYPYSSAKDHMGREKSVIPVQNIIDWDSDMSWELYLAEADQVFADDIRVKTQRGLVVGSAEFVRMIESMLKRSFVCRAQGRPRKE
ncbi:MAG: transposase [Candidatus Auribacterota bacterium]